MWELKKNGIYLSIDDSISVYKGNPYLEKIIIPSNGKEMFDFLKNFPVNDINIQNDVFLHRLVDYGLVYQLEEKVPKKLIRTKNFIDSIPKLNYKIAGKKIREARILLLGLGTGGSYVLEVLTKLGFEKFIIIDGDKVEENNIGAQYYSEKDIGGYKVDSILNKYPNYGIKSFIKHIDGFDDLKKIINLQEIDYIINCADDFELTVSILENTFKINSEIKVLLGGYSYLLQSMNFITQNNYKDLLLKAQKKFSSMNAQNLIACNTGSIFNGFLSAYSIAKLIFDDLLNISKTASCLVNLYSNEILFEKKSPELEQEKKYWKKIINEEMLFSLPLTEVSIILDPVQNLFVNTKNDNVNSISTTLEEKRREYNQLKLNFTEKQISLKEILYDVLIYVKKNYGSKIEKKLSIISSNFEKSTSKKASCQITRQNKILISVPETATNHGLISVIHELFHAVLYIIGDKDIYRHESFVLKNMIDFFYCHTNIKKYKILVNYFLLENLNVYRSLQVVNEYEKCYILSNFDAFKKKFPNFTNREDELIELLNKLISPTVPLSRFKYLHALENSKNEFLNLTLLFQKEILDSD